MPRTSLGLALLLGFSACAALPTNDTRLISLPPAGQGALYPATPIRWHIGPGCTGDPRRAPRSRQDLADECREDARRAGRDFVAVAISGGGAKAATFGGEALFMLERLGLLQHADIVSGVSGGSFAATLYALSCDPWDVGCQQSTERGARPVWSYRQSMERLSQGYMPLILEAGTRLFLPLLPVAIPNGRFAGYIDSAYLADAQGRGAGFTFADLNPRRPHLFVNSAIVSGQRFVLDTDEECRRVAQRAPDAGRSFQRRRAADEASHFSFTDFYFRRLCSDITTYPLARAVAASASFPALVDYARVADNARRRSFGGAPGDLLLTDGGANDNQGLIEIYFTLSEVLAGQRRSDARANLPPGTGVEPFARADRGLLLVINTSLTDATGVDEAPAYSPSVFGYVFGTVRRSSSAFDRASAANYSTRSRLYLRELELAAHHFEKHRGWKNWLGEERIRVQEVGLTVLDEYAFGGPEAHLRQTRNIWPDETSVLGTSGLYDPDWHRLDRQVRRHRRAFEAMRDPETRRRLGLSDIHPQCLFERSKEADAGLLSLASLPANVSLCLRHAARWSVALRAQELCDLMAGPTPPFNDPQGFAQACRDGRLQLLPAHLDGTGPGAGLTTEAHPLAACTIELNDPDIRAVLREAGERRRNSQEERDRLPDAQCRVVDRAAPGR